MPEPFYWRLGHLFRHTPLLEGAVAIVKSRGIDLLHRGGVYYRVQGTNGDRGEGGPKGSRVAWDAGF
jgi:hypothetical protein